MSAQVLAYVNMDSGKSSPRLLTKMMKAAEDQAEFFEEFNDPNAAYARCVTCD